MNDPSAALGKMVPGFDFLQNLARGAGSALPGMGHWVAPTLDPEEIGKRIEELRTVQFWLEQNVRMMAATIQALEVQRMTLATLHGMNVPLAELRGALMAGSAGAGGPATASPNDWQSGPFGQALAASAARRAAPPPAPPPASPPASPPLSPMAGATPPAAAAAASAPTATEGARPPGHDAATTAPGASPAMDPVRWWDSLTQQFTQLAGQALKDMPGQAAPGGDLMSRSTQTAQETLRQQAALVQQAAQALGAAAMAPAVMPTGDSRAGVGQKSSSGARTRKISKAASKPAAKTPSPSARRSRTSKQGSGAATPRRAASSAPPGRRKA